MSRKESQKTRRRNAKHRRARRSASLRDLICIGSTHFGRLRLSFRAWDWVFSGVSKASSGVYAFCSRVDVLCSSTGKKPDYFRQQVGAAKVRLRWKSQRPLGRFPLLTQNTLDAT